MWKSSQFSVDLFTFTKWIFNRKFNFLCISFSSFCSNSTLMLSAYYCHVSFLQSSFFHALQKSLKLFQNWRLKKIRYFVLWHICFNLVIVFYNSIFLSKSFAAHTRILKHGVKTRQGVQLQNELTIFLFVTSQPSYKIVCLL